MKKRVAIIAVIAAAVLAALAAALFAFLPRGIRTELPAEGIRSMISAGDGTVFFLSGEGLIRYNLSGDKKLINVYDAKELADATFEVDYNGADITYSDLQIDRLVLVADDGVTMVGKYAKNSLGRDADMFVLQDAADLGFSAGYYTEVERSDSLVNGVAAYEYGMYFKLGANGTNGHVYTDGSRFVFIGHTEDAPMPDGVTGVITDEGDAAAERPLFLVETRAAVELTDGSSAVHSFDRARVADAFVDGGKVYAVYKDGAVTVTGADGKETAFAELPMKVNDVNDAQFIDGRLYWFDKEGIKTCAAREK